MAVERIAFLAAEHAGDAARDLARRYGQHPRRRGRRHRRARRGRVHARCASPAHAARDPLLRHEPGHGRLSHERLRRRPAHRAPPPATPTTLSPLRMKATRFGGAEIELLAINEVSLHRQTGQGFQDPGLDRRPGPVGRDHLRRHPRRHAGRQLRVQPLRPRPDPSPERGGARAHRDQSVPPPALAWGAASARGAGTLRRARSEEAAGQRESRCARDPGRGGRRGPEDRDIEMRLLFDPERNLEERILSEQFRP